VRLEVLMAMKIQAAVSWVVTTCSDVVGYNHKDGGSMVLQNIGFLQHHYTVAPPRRP